MRWRRRKTHKNINKLKEVLFFLAVFVAIKRILYLQLTLLFLPAVFHVRLLGFLQGERGRGWLACGRAGAQRLVC